MTIRTQVGIVGAGPAGLFLSHLLHLRGIESVVLENRSREAIESTVRAGVLEQGTVDLMNATGVGERVTREGAVHRGIRLRFRGRDHRIALSELSGGRAITLYPQHEVIRDLVAARLVAGGEIRFGVSEVAFRGLDGDRPEVRWLEAGREEVLSCDYVAGCDGFHGVTRPAVAAALTTWSRSYPFGWFGILAEVPLLSPELVYAHHARGFALVSTRSPVLQRLYFQCDPREDPGPWSEERIWDELERRLESEEGWKLVRGPIVQKNVVGMRSFVAEPMRLGRLFLAGDAAHIVPATGAKGLNLAVADVFVLSRALAHRYATGRDDLLDRYSETCLRRVWSAERFSWRMTTLLHLFPDDDDFARRMRLAELDHVVGSPTASADLAEGYVGRPFE